MFPLTIVVVPRRQYELRDTYGLFATERMSCAQSFVINKMHRVEKASANWLVHPSTVDFGSTKQHFISVKFSVASSARLNFLFALPAMGASKLEARPKVGSTKS